MTLHSEDRIASRLSPQLARRLSNIMLVLWGVEAILTALLLLYVGPQGAQSFQSLLSPRRLVMAGGWVLIGSGLAWLGLKKAHPKTGQPVFLDWFFGRPAVVLGCMVGATIGGTVLGISLASPPFHRFLWPYLALLWPVLAWIILGMVQLIAASLLWGGSWYWAVIIRQINLPERGRKAVERMNVPWVGVVLLCLALAIGLTQIQYTAFDDEGDNLTTGWLLSQGYSLHKDVFSHHFPLPYYWVAGVVKVAGASFPAARASLLLFQLAFLAAAMFASQFYLQTGLLALVWSLSAHFHLGQQVLYDNFDASFMLPAFLIVFSWLLGRKEPARGWLLFTGVLTGCAFLSDPLMIYPGLVLLVGVFLWARARAQAHWLRQGVRSFLWAAAGAAIPLAIFAGSLAVQGTVKEFYQQAIWFNDNVYSRYTDASANRVGVILAQAGTGLDILNSQWRQDTRLFLPLKAWQAGLRNLTDYETWIFTNFSFRLAILTGAVGLALSGQWISGILFYLFGAALLARAPTGYHAGAFIGFGQAAGILILTGLAWPKDFLKKAPGSAAAPPRWKIIAHRILRLVWAAAAAVVVVLLAWLMFRSGQFLIENRAELNNGKELVEKYAGWRGQVQALTCGAEGVKFQYYPLRPMIYFSASLIPATRYTFLTPWVAEIASNEVIEELTKNPRAVVVISSQKELWQYQVKDFLSWLVDFLDKNYVQAGENIWISPELAARCPPP